ncbi:hypothetical protein E3N88_08566 [Mikania micrantha]|uniref:Uncharacterized protein n=1 Tax=Mikania micrantha TaxID=192012 RepID=A0A5N6PGK3_9ASTR|nr:hypothetical protein E3N88_08566 [Mikania micrantha]
MFVSGIYEEEKEPILKEDKLLKKLHFPPIFVIPSWLRDISPNSFTPRVVSIGPLHREHTHLKSMEKKKDKYMRKLLVERDTYNDCFKTVRNKIEAIKSCYSGMKEEIYNNDDKLVEMIVTDTCFILRFIYKLAKSGDIPSEKRIRRRSIALDLVLLENQIPFFVLQDIYDIIFKKKSTVTTPDLKTMLCGLLQQVNPFKKELNVENLSSVTSSPFHIVGLLHEFYQPGYKLSKISYIPKAHTAVKLHEVGVRFKPNQMLKWPMAMEFESSPLNPTIKMPEVVIDNHFEVVMRNLVVYEQCSPVESYVTSYVKAMNMLAATPKDIATLVESDVLTSHLGPNETASNIRNICKDVTFLDFYYMDVWEKAKKHYDSYWSRNLGVLKRKYFDTPWKAIALFVGFIGFISLVAGFTFRKP